MYDVWSIPETLTQTENRYLSVHDSGLISAYHEMVRMMFTLLSCTGECGWKQAAIHSSLCLDRALGHWFLASRLFLHASQMCTLILWATLSRCHCSGFIVNSIDTLQYNVVHLRNQGCRGCTCTPRATEKNFSRHFCQNEAKMGLIWWGAPLQMR